MVGGGEGVVGVGEHTGGARLSCNGDSRTGKELEWCKGRTCLCSAGERGVASKFQRL